MDKIFKELSEKYKAVKQTDAVELLTENIEFLCSTGFENYDLRKFKEFKEVTDELSCTTHVRTKMDGRWAEKLREVCTIYLNHLDVQYLLNEYFKGNNTDISQHLCRSKGIFRDCNSLNSKNASFIPEKTEIKC